MDQDFVCKLCQMMNSIPTNYLLLFIELASVGQVNKEKEEKPKSVPQNNKGFRAS